MKGFVFLHLNYKKVIVGYLILTTLLLATTIFTGNLEIFGFFFLFSFIIFFISIGGYIFIKKASHLNKYNKWSRKLLLLNENSITNTSKMSIYNSPITIHIFLIITVLLSLIFSTEDKTNFNGDYYSWFVEDLIFQIVSSILFVILGVFNPFFKIPKVIEERVKNQKEKLYNIITNTQKLFWLRVVICLFIVTWFIYKQWLVFPSFPKEHPLIFSIDVSLLLFVSRNLYLMVKYPKPFFAENIFRVLKSHVIIFASAFILTPLVPLTILTIYLLGINEREFNYEPLFFIAFNLIMIYLECTLYRGLSGKTTPKDLALKEKK